jgi:four helix bundle protein
VTEDEFKEKTQGLAVLGIETASLMPRGIAADVVSRQLVRCATSVGANYRAACRAKSRADMLAKLGIVEEEADEVLYWLQIAYRARFLTPDSTQDLYTEAESVLRMIVASRKTLRNGPQTQNRKPKTGNP